MTNVQQNHMHAMARSGLAIMELNGVINKMTEITPDQARQAIKLGLAAQFADAMKNPETPIYR